MTNTERIQKAREMRNAGEFHRTVTAREPESIDHDCLKLECGHETLFLAFAGDPSRVYCSKCAAAWLAQGASE